MTNYSSPKSFFEEKRQHFTNPNFANSAKFIEELSKNFKRIIIDIVRCRIKDMDYIYFKNVTILETLKDLSSMEYRKALLRYHACYHYLHVVIPNYYWGACLGKIMDVDLSFETSACNREIGYNSDLTHFYGAFMRCLDNIYFGMDPMAAFHDFQLVYGPDKSLNTNTI